MATRGGIPDFVLGVSEFEQNDWPIPVSRRFIERPAEQCRGGVGGSAAERRSRCLPEHVHDLLVAACRGREEMHRDRTRIGALLVQQTSGARVEIGALGRGQVLIDCGPHDRMHEAQWLTRNQDRKVNEARGQPARGSGIDSGQFRAHCKPRLLAKNRHRAGQWHRLRVEVTHA